MKQVWLKVLVIIMMPYSAFAEDIVFSTDAVESCQESAPISECIAASAHACMEDTVGGYSTPGTVLCLNAEQAYWEERLSQDYNALVEDFEESDVDMQAHASSNGFVAVAQVGILRDMQDVWLRFRVAACEARRFEWGDGTGKAQEYAECMLRMTAQRVAYLQTFR